MSAAQWLTGITVLFALMRLSGLVEWSWWIVMAPLWVIVVIGWVVCSMFFTLVLVTLVRLIGKLNEQASGEANGT